MSRQARIISTLSTAFTPLHLDVINDSPKHNVPAGSELHFSVIIVSTDFKGKTRLERHRLVYSALSNEMPELHALSIHTYSPEEWPPKEKPTLPPCRGGFGQ